MNKKQRQLLLMIPVLVFLAGCGVAKVVRLVRSGEPAVFSGDEIVIPFESEGHLIVLDVCLNDSDEIYHFIMDTGAMTVLDDGLAEELGLEAEAEVHAVGSGGGTNSADLLKLDSVRIGELAVYEAGASVFDLAMIDTKSDYHIRGIIGSNILRFFKIIIDYDSQTVTFSQDTSPEVPGNDGFYIPIILDMQSGFAPGFNCFLNGQIVAAGIIDTGARGYLSVPTDLLTNLKTEDTPWVESVGVLGGGSFSMIEKMYLTRLDSILLGPLGLKNVVASSVEGRLILFGMDFLKNFETTINYPGKQLILKPKTDSFLKTNISSYGLGVLEQDDGSYQVSGYWGGSSADEAGLEIGAEVLSINEKPAGDYSIVELPALFENGNEALEIVVLGTNGTNRVVLRKKPLIP